MMQDIFCSLADTMRSTGYFNKVYDFVEIKHTTTDGSTSRPKYNTGNNGWQDVQNFDVGGMCYFRKSGARRYTEVDRFSNYKPACNGVQFYELAMPIRMVVAKLRQDDPFADDDLADDLISAINGTSISIQNATVAISFQNTETEGFAVWNQENKGVDFEPATMLRFSYIAIDFTVAVTASLACITSCLNPYPNG